MLILQTFLLENIYFIMSSLFVFLLGGIMSKKWTDIPEWIIALGAGVLMWIIIGIVYSGNGSVSASLNHHLGDFSKLFLFLMAAMVFITAMKKTGLFTLIEHHIIKRQYSDTQLFWRMGWLTFFLSAFLDNAVAALIMGSIIKSAVPDTKTEEGLTHSRKPFRIMLLVNTVSAANAGGAFSAIGDTPSILLYQSGKASVFDLLSLFPASVINYIVLAFVMTYSLKPKKKEKPMAREEVLRLEVQRHGIAVVILFLLSIVLSVTFTGLWKEIPPFAGMLIGIVMLYWYGRKHRKSVTIDLDAKLQEIEMPMLLLFCGLMLAVGALGHVGILKDVSHLAYSAYTPETVAFGIGILSAALDNVGLMFAVLGMNPTLDTSGWLLITFALSVGGNLLSMGSAAGIALMGQSKEYGFFEHLKWLPALLLAYVASMAFQIFVMH